MKCYGRGKYLGDDYEGDNAHIDTGHYYDGLFLVFEDGPGYEGAVLFSVARGKLVAKCPKLFWQFRDKDLLPEFDEHGWVG